MWWSTAQRMYVCVFSFPFRIYEKPLPALEAYLCLYLEILTEYYNKNGT